MSGNNMSGSFCKVGTGPYDRQVCNMVDKRYINKNVLFTDLSGNQHKAYITNGNVARLYNNNFNSITGRNQNCPIDVIPITNKVSNINNLSNDMFRDARLPFKKGNDMRAHTHCGYELKNILFKVDKADILKEATTYVGCYDINGITNMSPDKDNANYNFESCKYLAYQTGNQYFGLITTTGSNQKKCFMTNTLPLKIYPDNKELITMTKIIPFTLLASGSQSSIAYVKIEEDTDLKYITNPNTRQTTNLCGYDSSGNIIGYFGISKSGRIGVEYLVLGNSGNISIIQNNTLHTQHHIDRGTYDLSMITIPPQILTTTDKVVPGGKIEKNNPLVSFNKKFTLVLDDMGILKLIYNINTIKCNVANQVNYGISDLSNNTVAIYKFNNSVKNPLTYGNNIAYINEGGDKTMFSSEMLELDNSYVSIPKSDMADMTGTNTINNPGITGATDCKKLCNDNNSCYGYTFDTTTKNCKLNTQYSYIVPSTNTLNVRKQKIKKNINCHSKIFNNNLDKNLGLKEWNSFKTDSQIINSSYKCMDLTEQFENMGSSIEGLVNPQPSDFIFPPTVLDGVNYRNINDTDKTAINTKNTTILDAANLNNSFFTKNNNFASYQVQTNNNIPLKSKYDDNKTTFTNFIVGNGNVSEPMLNMNTLDEFLGDTDLMIIQEKYKNIFWSILAIGTFIFTISNLKK